MTSKELVLWHPIENFYSFAKTDMINANDLLNLRYITSRSTEESISHIKYVCSIFDNLCKNCSIPTTGVFLKKTGVSIKAFKYLICNTNFDCQKLLSNDTVSGHLVNSNPTLSLYLLIEIIWHIHFDDILAESMLHFPVDLCAEIAEIIPRCIDLLDFQRAVKFLTTFVQNIYKKVISLEDTGSQTQDLNRNVKSLVGIFQELLLLFANKKVFKLTDGFLDDQYKRCGILLKKIIQMVKICFNCKSKKFESTAEMQEFYKLTFGDISFQKIDSTLLDQCLTDMNQGLIRLLLKKVKEIDCNIYLNWTEYDDEENTSMCLQRAIGLECYFFIESTKEFIDCDNKDFLHLTECLQQLASKPDPNNSVESLHFTDLCQGVFEGKKECLMALFKRYKEWDNTIIDVIDSNICVIDKEVCEQLFEHLAMELCNSHDLADLEKLQLYSLFLAHAFVSLKITDLYEIAVKFILQFGENKKLENDIDITNFENFLMHNPNLSNAKNLRVVIFFLCLKTFPTLKILFKMTIGHSDYPDVAISIDDLMILLPILKIKTETILETLRTKCEEKRKGIRNAEMYRSIGNLIKKEPPKGVTLAVRVLQEICLEGPKWNPNKFSSLLQAMFYFCTVKEVTQEVFAPLLMMDLYWTDLKPILIEIQKVIDKCDHQLNLDIVHALQKQGLELLNTNHTSRYITDELLIVITDLIKEFSYKLSDAAFFSTSQWGHREIFLWGSTIVVDHYTFLHQLKTITKIVKYFSSLNDDDTIRYVFLKCTKKQYLSLLENVIAGNRLPFKWTSKADVCDNIIRLTLENCLLCLEYPEVAPPDSISFMLRRLIQSLPLITVSKKKSNFTAGICRNLDAHLSILKSSIEYTAISQAYNELIRRCEKSKLNLPEKFAALEQFASSCSQESEKLKVFTEPHSPLGIKLWLTHDSITALLDENASSEEYIMKLEKLLNTH